MRDWIVPLLIGSALWSWAGWAAHPRELWDVPAFWPAWGLAVVLAGLLGFARSARPLRDTGLLFLPIVAVLTVSTVLTGGSANLLPLGLVAVVVLALPGLLLAVLARRLGPSRH